MSTEDNSVVVRVWEMAEFLFTREMVGEKGDKGGKTCLATISSYIYQ